MTGSFCVYFLFYWLAGFYIAWLESVCHLVQDSFRFPPEFRRLFQYILSRQLLSWKPRLSFFARSLAWDSPVRSRRPLSWKLNSFFPISADEKGATSVFRVLANHSASLFFLHPVRRFIRTTISIQYIPFFIHPVTECKHLLAFILTRICYFGCEELTYISYSSFNGQSLTAC